MKREPSILYWIAAVVLLAGKVSPTEARCDEAPTIMVNVTEDSPLVLECEGPAPVTWDSHRYIGTQREVITSPTNNAGEQRSWLIYRNATRSDPRVTCKTGSGSCAHMHYSVIVFTVPSNAHITASQSGLTANTVEFNNSATLSCSASGTAPLQYLWYHNGTTMSGATSGSYRVTSAAFHDAGVYTCEVSNWAGSDNGTFTLKVQVPPTISSLSSSAPGNKLILPRTGSTSVNMTCTASGDASSVTFQWMLNGIVYSIGVIEFNNGNQAISRLSISPVTPAHGGDYRCFTSNNVGTDSRALTLMVVEPAMVVAITVNGSAAGGVVHALNGTRSDFACIVSGTSPLNTSWELQTMRGDSNRLGTEFNSILTQGDEGNYTCAVVNTQEGLSDNATVTVNVFDPITLTSVAMTTLVHKENDQVTLRCSFFRDPDDPVLFPQVIWNGPSFNATTTATQTNSSIYESTVTFTATRQHHGQFTCSVNDTLVGNIEALFNLTVYYPPTNIALQPATTSVSNGSLTTFTCTGNGRPPLEFNITRSFPDGTSSTISGAIFVLHPSAKEELGTNLLTCSATNSEFNTPVHSANLNITIRGAPEVVNSSSIQVISRSFTSVSVQWTQPQDNFDTIQYYQIRIGECETSNHTGSPCQLVRIHQLPYNSSRYLSLSSLSPFTTYTLEIAAGNGVGFGPYSNAVVIRTVQQDEATVKNLTAILRGSTVVLLQWHADVNLTQTSTAFSYFRLTRLRQGFAEEENTILPLSDASCSNIITQIELCHEWEGFATGAVYSVWIEMVYSYPATGGRVTLTVTIPPVAIAESSLVGTFAGGALAGVLMLVVFLVALILVVFGCCKGMRRKGSKHYETGETGEAVGNVNYNGKDEVNAHMDKPDAFKYSKSDTCGDGCAYEPLNVNQVVHHSYSKCTYGQATEGGLDGEYAPLDITRMQDAEYTVPVVVETPGEAYEYANSMFDHEYVALRNAASTKVELLESKTGLTAFKEGTATECNSTGYANTRLASGEDGHKDDTKAKKRQHFTLKALKGKTRQPPPTTSKSKMPKQPPGSKSAAATQANVVVKPLSPVMTSVTRAVSPQSTHTPLQLSAKMPPEATVQDSKSKKVPKPKTQEKGVKSPILPKHVTAATASPPSSPKGRNPASNAPPLVTKKTPAKNGESASTGKVSVAELARRLEKGK